MKEADMAEVGRLISRALGKVDDETGLAEVKRDVHELSARFPLYAARLEAYGRALAAHA
jgi:glycine/serine hydroxymethyltransferase